VDDAAGSLAMTRDERAGDEPAIHDVVTSAFAQAAHSSGDEAAIVARLREAGALTLSLVAVESDRITGHVAVSPVLIEGQEADWFGLGPVAVLPDLQRRGIGAALVAAALQRLRDLGAAGCVVLGDPDYYSRFGFEPAARLRYGEVSGPYFQLLAFGAEVPEGEVTYHQAFGGG